VAGKLDEPDAVRWIAEDFYTLGSVFEHPTHARLAQVVIQAKSGGELSHAGHAAMRVEIIQDQSPVGVFVR
jgi:hypothetical protein